MLKRLKNLFKQPPNATLPPTFRKPAPGSNYDYKPSNNSKIADNSYYKRDKRRDYPATLVIPATSEVSTPGSGYQYTISDYKPKVPGHYPIYFVN